MASISPLTESQEKPFSIPSLPRCPISYKGKVRILRIAVAKLLGSLSTQRPHLFVSRPTQGVP